MTAEQVAVIAPITRGQQLAAARRQDVDLSEVDQGLALAAATQPHDTLTDMVTRYQARLDPDGPEPDPTEGRRLSIAKHSDGSVTGRFDLDPVGGEKLPAAIESIVQAARPQGDARTRSQQQADALVQLGDNALASASLPFAPLRHPPSLRAQAGGAHRRGGRVPVVDFAATRARRPVSAPRGRLARCGGPRPGRSRRARSG